MKNSVRIGTLLVALLLGVVPPGTCARLAFNPHGACCPVQWGEAASESTCCKDGSSCAKHSQKNNLPSPCCAFTPNDLAFVENSSTATYLVAAPSPATLPICVFDAFAQAPETSSALYAHAPPNTAPPCPLYIINAALLV